MNASESLSRSRRRGRFAGEVDLDGLIGFDHNSGIGNREGIHHNGRCALRKRQIKISVAINRDIQSCETNFKWALRAVATENGHPFATRIKYDRLEQLLLHA